MILKCLALPVIILNGQLTLNSSAFLKEAKSIQISLENRLGPSLFSDEVEINCKKPINPKNTDAIISGIGGFVGGVLILGVGFLLFRRLRKSNKAQPNVISFELNRPNSSNDSNKISSSENEETIVSEDASVNIYIKPHKKSKESNYTNLTTSNMNEETSTNKNTDVVNQKDKESNYIIL